MSSIPKQTAPLRIAFHAINGVGLGHFMRLTAIAREMRDVIPEARILFLTNVRDRRILMQSGFDFVQFPLRLDEPHADPNRASSGLPAAIDCAAQQAALRAFLPHLVVFDTHAPGPIVEAAREVGARTVLVLRELRPDAFRRFLEGFSPWSFDRIVIPHEPSEIDESAIPADLPVQLCGPVLRNLPAQLSPTVDRHMGRAHPLLVATAGGGGQPVGATQFLRAVCGAHEVLRGRFPRLKTILVCGPNARTVAEFRGIPGVVSVAWTPALPHIMERADVVVSQAGYNAICELRALRKPAVLVPGHRKMEDQAARARRLLAIGAATLAAPRAEAIAKKLARLLADPTRRVRASRAHERWPFVQGNREAALALLRPVYSMPCRTKRVVLIAHDYPPRIGGMETVAYEMARAIVRRGIEVIVYTVTTSGRAPVAQEAGTDAFPDGLRVRSMYVPRRSPKRIDLWGDLLLTVHALLVDCPDVVHLTHAGLAPWIPVLRASLPCAITSHVHGNDMLAPWVEHAGQEATYRKALVEGLNEADGVVAVSSFSRGLATNAGVRPDKVCVLPNGVDASRFAPGPIDPRLRERLGIHPADEVVLTVSRLARRKGHRTLIRALPTILSHRPNALVAFTGCNDGLLSEIRDLARELRVEDRIRNLGWVSEQDLPSLYRLARVFVLVPDVATETDVEGFGIAMLEAAATGLPTVSSRTGGVPEATQEGETGAVVNPGDAGALAQAVVYLLSNPEEALRKGGAGRQRVLRNMSWDNVAASLVQQWDATFGNPIRPAQGSVVGLQALAVSKASTGDPCALTLRRSIGKVRHVADLAYLARRHVYAIRKADEQRRQGYRRWIQRGRPLRLRTTGDLGQRFFQALEDCRSLGHCPDVEVKLKSFLTPAFQNQVLPFVRYIHLLHGLPGVETDQLLAQIGHLDWTGTQPPRSLRLYMVPEASNNATDTMQAVPQAHKFREAFRGRGVTVVPPPELMRYLSLTPSPGPETAMVEPSNRCTLSCPTCPTGTGKIRPLPDLSQEHFGRILDGIGPALRTLALWNYGEPTLNPDLDKLVAMAKERGVATVKVSSNGLALRGDRGRALLQSGLDVLILSVDGASQSTYEKFRQRGSFEVVAEAIRGLCEGKRTLGLSRPSLELQFIVMRHNEHEIGSIRELARQWGVDRLRLKTFGATDQVSRQLIPLDESLSRYGADRSTPKAGRRFCSLPWDHVVVNVDGSISPCCYLRPDMDSSFVMGNVFETPFAEIWRGARYQAFRRSMLEQREEMPICRSCHGSVLDLNASVEDLS